MVESVLLFKDTYDGTLLCVSVIASTACNSKNNGFHVRANILKARGQRQLSVDFLDVCLGSQEGKQSDVPFVVNADFLAQDWRREVVGMGFSQCDHSFLTEVLWTVQSKHSVGCNAILYKEARLVFGLGEVYNDDTRADFKGKLLDERQNQSVFVGFSQTLFWNKSSKSEQLSVCSFTKHATQGWLARGVSSNHESNLWKHSGTGGVPHLNGVACSVNFTDFSKVLVHFNDRLWLFVVGLKPLCNNILSVIRPPTGLCSFHAASDADFLWSVEVEYSLCLANHLLEVDGLVDSSWEAVDEIVLKMLGIDPLDLKTKERYKLEFRAITANQQSLLIIFKLLDLLWRVARWVH